MNIPNQIGLASSRSPAGFLARRLLSMTALSAIAAAGSIVIPTASYAQVAAAGHADTAQPAPQAAQAPVEEVVVTGSRVITNGYDAPTPVSVVATEAIEAAARPDLADFVNTLPAVSGSFSPQSGATNLSLGHGGINAISLHGLGPQRTLILLDGHRVVSSSADDYIDVSALPQGLVSRVDVVTGGASAAYGSDAVGGVVNFILDKTFTGVKGDISGGVSTYGDDRSYKIDVSGGTAFADGKGHALLYLESEQTAGIPNYAAARSWGAYGYEGIANPNYTATNGQPAFLFANDVGPDQVVPGGIITSGPLKGITFGPGGVPRQFNYGPITAGIVTQGGDWAEDKSFQNETIDPPVNRKNAFARVSYDLTDNINVYGEASWADDWEANGIAGEFYAGNITLSGSNAFLPASVAAQAKALNVTSFSLGTFFADNQLIQTTPNSSGAPGLVGLQRRETNRYLLGSGGKFDAMDTDWTWDLYYQVGETRDSEKSADNMNVSHFNLAIDAVTNPATGAIVCRSTLTNPNNGCVPLNLFGVGVNSAAALNYSMGTSQRDENIIENATGFTVNGKPFSDWAGPVSLATGAEWRNEKVHGVVDPTSAAFGWFNSSYQPTNGSYNVKEAFVESLIPLAKNTPWAENFDVDVAGRITDYSNSGTVETWKVGPTWQPIDDIRFRGSISRDIRAPNLGELFAGGSNSASAGAGLLDPFNGNKPATGSQNINGVGNPLLKPEVGISKGLGAVVTPTFFQGFTASVDYWNIKLNNQITTLAAQDVLNQCYLGSAQFCSGVSRPGGVLTVAVANYNAATAYYRGVDFEAGYKLQLDSIASGMNGSLDFRFLGTLFLTDYSNNNISPVIQLVGSPTIRKFKWNAPITYNLDPITILVEPRGFSAGVTNTAWIQCTSGCPASTTANPTVSNDYLRGDFDVDTTFTYKITEEFSTYFSVQNWLNRSPPPTETGVTGSDTILGLKPEFSQGTYAATGRMFRLGVRFKM